MTILSSFLHLCFCFHFLSQLDWYGNIFGLILISISSFTHFLMLFFVSACDFPSNIGYVKSMHQIIMIINFFNSIITQYLPTASEVHLEINCFVRACVRMYVWFDGVHFHKHSCYKCLSCVMCGVCIHI